MKIVTGDKEKKKLFVCLISIMILLKTQKQGKAKKIIKKST